jgi:hypothetical protein
MVGDPSGQLCGGGGGDEIVGEVEGAGVGQVEVGVGVVTRHVTRNGVGQSGS